MAATKNAHDWHCEDHDTYGWRGEECRKCPTAPSEADALRNELNRLVDLCRHMNDERLCLAHGVVEMKPFPETLERGVIISEPLLREIERRYNKFKAVEAENKRLREALNAIAEGEIYPVQVALAALAATEPPIGDVES